MVIWDYFQASGQKGAGGKRERIPRLAAQYQYYRDSITIILILNMYRIWYRGDIILIGHNINDIVSTAMVSTITKVQWHH